MDPLRGPTVAIDPPRATGHGDAVVRCIIVDDERLARTALEELLSTHCPTARVLASVDSVPKARVAIERHAPDLVFLDIAMPGASGFELVETLPASDFRVVFVTAHGGHELRALRCAALDYLLKPVDPRELQAAVDRLGRSTAPPASAHDLARSLLRDFRRGNAIRRIAISDMSGVNVIQLDDVIRFQAESNTTRVFRTPGKPLLASHTLKHFEELCLREDFVRVHSRHLVNLQHVKRYVRKDGVLTMDDGSQVEVARRRRQEVLDRLGVQ